MSNEVTQPAFCSVEIWNLSHFFVTQRWLTRYVIQSAKQEHIYFLEFDILKNASA